jgi:hypothetical protein
VLSDTVWPAKDQPYRAVKYGLAGSVLLLAGVAYLTIRNIDGLRWSWLLVSGLLAFGAAGYFKFIEDGSRDTEQRMRHLEDRAGQLSK